jgi:hypothetical protein
LTQRQGRQAELQAKEDERHPAREISSGTLKRILADLGLTEDDLAGR